MASQSHERDGKIMNPRDAAFVAALLKLKRLDDYWAKRPKVDQMEGYILVTDKEPCGCFGAHICCALLTPEYEEPPASYHFFVARELLTDIGRPLGINRDVLWEIVKSYSGVADPFGVTTWGEHPSDVWPRISAEFRRRAEDLIVGV